jgi:hypothetical protein
MFGSGLGPAAMDFLFSFEHAVFLKLSNMFPFPLSQPEGPERPIY